LATIDRRVLAKLGHDESWQMVRVPVSSAVWSTWRRYCSTVGLSMGRGIGTLINHELQLAVGEGVGSDAGLGGELDRQLLARSVALDARERLVEEREQRLRALEHHVRAGTSPLGRVAPRVGRNERCPCGSGLKYKRCHGL
jgi:hypothetical protein